MAVPSPNGDKLTNDQIPKDLQAHLLLTSRAVLELRTHLKRVLAPLVRIAELLVVGQTMAGELPVWHLEDAEEATTPERATIGVNGLGRDTAERTIELDVIVIVEVRGDVLVELGSCE